MSYDNYSCIKEITKNVPITLSTAYQGNEITGISNVLDSWKRQYIQQLQGIVVSYKNVTLTSKFAYIKSDYPVILCNVRATFELFIPTIGSIIKGKINRISHDYIGCLVHNSINVAIDRSRNEYDSVSDFVALDQLILFEITHIGFKRKIIRVKGKITQECVNIMKNLHLSAVETDAVDNNITSSSHDLNASSDLEEHENNYDRDLENEDQSHNLLHDDTKLFDVIPNNTKSKKRKKKSGKFQTEQNLNRHSESLGTESGELSPSLLSINSRLLGEDLSDVKHHSPKKKKKKSSILQNDNTIYKTFESTDEKSGSASPNFLFDASTELLDEILVDRDFHSSKRKKKKNNEKLQTKSRSDEQPVKNTVLDISSASGRNSPKKKKSQQTNYCSSDQISFHQIKEEYSTDTSSHFSSSSKKKKCKRSKSDTLSSSSLFSDSLSSNKDETEPFKIPRSPSKKKQKLLEDTFSATHVSPNPKCSDFPLNDKDTLLNALSTSELSQKTNIKMEDFDSLIEVLSPYDPSLESQMYSEVLTNKSVEQTKKVKKRKLESPDKNGLPKKKKKKMDEKSSFVKSSNKHKPDKTKKKRKEKSERDSKKDKKKKSKNRVISSKKKLPKLKKKKKEKIEKLKKKKLKKLLKHAEKDVP